MPEITCFNGLRFYMNFLNHEHNPPHIHVESSGRTCCIDLHTCKISKGSLSTNEMKLATQWVEKYQKELIEMWETQEFRRLPAL